MSMQTLQRSAVLGFLAIFIVAGQSSHGMELKEALAQFESGASIPTRCAADAKIGTRREISRFQILPAVWRKYSGPKDYQNPTAAWSVAEKILLDRYTWFRSATGREWDAIDFYIMWNAPGDYQKANWDRHRISRVVMERAQRFANLFQSEDRVMVRASLDDQTGRTTTRN